MLSFFSFLGNTGGKSLLSMRHLRFYIDFLENGRQTNVFAHGLGAGVQVVCTGILGERRRLWVLFYIRFVSDFIQFCMVELLL